MNTSPPQDARKLRPIEHPTRGGDAGGTAADFKGLAVPPLPRPAPTTPSGLPPSRASNRLLDTDASEAENLFEKLERQDQEQQLANRTAPASSLTAADPNKSPGVRANRVSAVASTSKD